MHTHTWGARYTETHTSRGALGSLQCLKQGASTAGGQGVTPCLSFPISTMEQIIRDCHILPSYTSKENTR